MKTRTAFLAIVLLIVTTWILPNLCQALLIMVPEKYSSGIRLTQVPEDDPNDADQPTAADRDVIVQIDNEARRYISIIIDKTINGQAAGSVDNGPNDDLVGPGTKMLSVETLELWAQCMTHWSVQCGLSTPKNRRYIFTVPANTEPGTEIKFRVRAVGPALASLTLPDYDIDQIRVLEPFGWTLWEVLFLDWLKIYLGSALPDQMHAAVAKEFINYVKMDSTLLKAFREEKYTDVFWALVNFSARSELLKAYAEDQGLKGAQDLAAAVGMMSGALGWVTIGEMMNAFTQLAFVNWQETFEVVVVIPKIDSIEPASGSAGGTVTIHGKGFDPYTTSNNKVFFTGLNSNGVPVLNQLAEVVAVPAEDTITVQVPAGFQSGPVMVCTGPYCSNTDVNFGNPLPAGVSIITPMNGSSVSGSISVSAVVPSPPAPFPISTARLLIDNAPAQEKQVTSANFDFVLDTAPLESGTHTLTVELATGASTQRDSVQVNVTSASPTLTITSPTAGSTVSGSITISATISNPPSPFPAGSEARLLVDGGRVASGSVSGPSISLSANGQTIGEGPHTFTMEIDLAGEVLTASVQATVRTQWYPDGYIVYTTRMRAYPAMYWNPDNITVSYIPQGEKYIIRATPTNKNMGLAIRNNSGLWCGTSVSGQIGQPTIMELSSLPCGYAYLELFPIPWDFGGWPNNGTCNTVEIAYPPGGETPYHSNAFWCN